jgi:hypothetical protein
MEERPVKTDYFCTKYKDASYFDNLLMRLELTEFEKDIIKIRYLSILHNFQRRARNYSIIFFTGHFITTVGSLFVPALLSIQFSDKTTTGNISFQIQIYWTTWIISLLVTIFNGIVILFKIDRKYYFLNAFLERLRSEGWQYFSLTGRYSGHLIDHQTPTHKNQFVFFTHQVEKFKMRQVEEEYFKAEEKNTQSPVANTNRIQHELYPPSPDQPLNLMSHIPDPIEKAVNVLVNMSNKLDESKLEREPDDIIIIDKN